MGKGVRSGKGRRRLTGIANLSPAQKRLWYSVMGIFFLIPSLLYWTVRLGPPVSFLSPAAAFFASAGIGFGHTVLFFCRWVAPLLVFYCGLHLLEFKAPRAWSYFLVALSILFLILALFKA